MRITDSTIVSAAVLSDRYITDRFLPDKAIDRARQKQLMQCLATAPNIGQGIYPFKGMKLSRADIEWLLATLENARNSTTGSDEKQNGPGLDLRDADLRYVDLHALPLAHMRGSLNRTEWDQATEEQRAAAAVLLTGAYLSEAHLELADLREVHLDTYYAISI